MEGVGEELVANEGERHEVGLGPLALAVPFSRSAGVREGNAFTWSRYWSFVTTYPPWLVMRPVEVVVVE